MTLRFPHSACKLMRCRSQHSLHICWIETWLPSFHRGETQLQHMQDALRKHQTLKFWPAKHVIIILIFFPFNVAIGLPAFGTLVGSRLC